MLTRYLRERGDANIKSIRDLIDKSKYYRDIRPDAGFIDRKAALEEMNSALTLDLATIFQDRFANQQIVLQCMAQENLDALVSPAGNIPAYILGAPMEPPLAGRTNSVWGLLGQHGIPTLSVPAGFTTQVFDRVRDRRGSWRYAPGAPVPARLPVGIMFFGRPFSEPTLLRIASAYEADNAPHSAAGLRTGCGAVVSFHSTSRTRTTFPTQGCHGPRTRATQAMKDSR